MEFEEALVIMLAAQAMLCSDETGLRVKQTLYWCHVMCTEQLTYYAIHDRRGSAAFKDIGVLTGFKQRLIHDCLSSYDAYCPNALHGLCNAHVIRELTAVAEQGDLKAGLRSSLIASMRQMTSSRIEGSVLLRKGCFHGGVALLAFSMRAQERILKKKCRKQSEVDENERKRKT